MIDKLISDTKLVGIALRNKDCTTCPYFKSLFNSKYPVASMHENGVTLGEALADFYTADKEFNRYMTYLNKLAIASLVIVGLCAIIVDVTHEQGGYSALLVLAVAIEALLANRVKKF